MKTKFIQTDSRYKAKKECLWAAKIVKVHDGFLCFESIQDYITWKNQK